MTLVLVGWLLAAMPDARPLVEDLFTGDAVAWRRAEVTLAHAGVRGMAAVEADPRARWAKHRARLTEYLCLALIDRVTPEELARHPVLVSIAREHLEAADRLAAPLVQAELYDSGEHSGPVLHTAPPPSPARLALAALVDLQGFSVPVARRLLESPSPGTRAYGIEILHLIGPVSARDVLQARLGDKVELSVWHGDCGGRESLGKRAREALKVIIDPDDTATPEEAARRAPTEAASAAVTAAHRVALWIERDLWVIGRWNHDGNPNVLINATRAVGAFDATSDDAWWAATRPLLLEWPEIAALPPGQQTARIQALRPPGYRPRPDPEFPPSLCIEEAGRALTTTYAVRNCLAGFSRDALSDVQRALRDCLSREPSQATVCLVDIAVVAQDVRLCQVIRDDRGEPSPGACEAAVLGPWRR